MQRNTVHQADIKTIYASSFLHASLWAFVSGQKICGKDINESIRCFMTFMDCKDLEFNSLKQAYYRKNSEYVKCSKGISADIKIIFESEELGLNELFDNMKQMIRDKKNKEQCL